MSTPSEKKGFLVLTIPIGKGFWIGDSYLSVRKIKNNVEVSIGIKAPKSVKIDRKRPFIEESEEKK